ncbi:hypothetical protein BGZ76_009421 [Entomortierella beljakovae]|nr:hypothetical protein BGZ76_009421 [Entomortierella beljakovae]
MRNSAPKEKSLTIHIDTDYIGPNGLPLVYGSTPDKIGAIKGNVKFSTNYECRGKDIVILYEAKAEAHWTAFENKKVVQHQTEEILGHHIWHFPLEHTKPGGKKIMPGSYTKEFEIPLVHPSLQNKSLTQTPNASTYASHTSLLLPSSSNNPHARIKYTIRALLRRPFPTIHNIESTQEVWVLQSSLPPPPPSLLPKNALLPSKISSTIDSTTTGVQSIPTTSAQEPPQILIDSSHNNNDSNNDNNNNNNDNNENNHNNNNPNSHSNDQPEHPKSPSILTKDQESPFSSSPSNEQTPVLALSASTKVLKSYLAMIPTFDLSRPKHFLLDTFSDTHKPVEKVAKELPKDENLVSTLPSSLSAGSSSSTLESESLADSSTSSSSVGSSKGEKLDIDEISSVDDGEEEEEEEEQGDNSANYTGVWEPFHMPYSCSLPSETVHLGQSVPITIQFGSNKRSRMKRRESRKKGGGRDKSNLVNGGAGEEEGGGGGEVHHHRHHHHHHQRQEPKSSHDYRFVVKKGILKVVEHTHLKEFMVAPPTLIRQQHKSNPAMVAGYTNSMNNNNNNNNNNVKNGLPPIRVSTDLSKRISMSDRQQQQQIQQSDHKTALTAQELSPEQIPGIATHQANDQIYQEKGHNRSHSHFFDHIRRASHHEQMHTKGSTEELPMHSRRDSSDLRRFFKPKRHSVDVASRYTPTLALTSLRGTQSPNIQSPTASGFSHQQQQQQQQHQPYLNISNTRIINSIEAKFKTEVITVSLTPHLHQRELQYQKRLNKMASLHQIEEVEDQHEDDDDNEHGDNENNDGKEKVKEKGDKKMMVKNHVHRGGNVWKTTIWFQIPGPSELATFTETKHIVMKHTLQLILLCGLVDDSDNEEIEQEAGLSRASSFGSAITEPGINKEFRLESK